MFDQPAIHILVKFHVEQSRPASGWIFPARFQNSDRMNTRIHMDPHNWYTWTFKPLLRGLGLPYERRAWQADGAAHRIEH